MNLESPKVTTNKSQQEMFNFLSNVENYRQIMPSSMEKFEVTGPEKFRFSLKGMPQIELQITEKHEPELIVLGSTSDNLNFALNVHIEQHLEDQAPGKLNDNILQVLPKFFHAIHPHPHPN